MLRVYSLLRSINVNLLNSFGTLLVVLDNKLRDDRSDNSQDCDRRETDDCPSASCGFHRDLDRWVGEEVNAAVFPQSTAKFCKLRVF